MDYKSRINRLRTEMENQGVSGVFIPLDASLEYFTGAPRAERGVTCQRQNSAEYACLLITEAEILYFNSRLSALGLLAKAEQYPLISHIIPFPDKDMGGETFVSACSKLDLKGKKVAHVQDISSSLVLGLQRDLSVSWVNFDRQVQMLRACKDEEEQQLMVTAAGICDKIYDGIIPQLQPGVAVTEIAREIDRLARFYGAENNSFTTSVMNFGPEKGVGYGDFHPQLRPGYVLAFDYGVVYQGYCSDFGRTIFIGEPAADLVKGHELVMEAQKAGIAALTEKGITGAEVNRRARQVLLEAGYDKEFSHRLGHGIGKDVHERPFLAEGEDTRLEAGMFFTVEPSLCFPYRAMLRVEDVVCLTGQGVKNTNSTTRDLVVIG